LDPRILWDDIMGEEAKVLIIGMGNPILTDDGVGLLIARAIEGRIPKVEILTTPLVGLNLLDQLQGYDKLFLIDALISQTSSCGQLKKCSLGEGAIHLFTSHGVDFFELLELGRRLGLAMPEVSEVYGIEIENPVAFGEELTPPLSEKIPSLIESITEDIQTHLKYPSIINSNGSQYLTRK
jgi:hydrogenase maturation protease